MIEKIKKHDIIPLTIFSILTTIPALALLQLVKPTDDFLTYYRGMRLAESAFLISTITILIMYVYFRSGDRLILRNKSKAVDRILIAPIGIAVLLIVLEINAPLNTIFILFLLINIFFIYRYIKHYGELGPWDEMDEKHFSEYGIAIELISFAIMAILTFSLLYKQKIVILFGIGLLILYSYFLNKNKIKTIMDVDTKARLIGRFPLIFLTFFVRSEKSITFFGIFFIVTVAVYFIYRQLFAVKKFSDYTNVN